LAVRGPKTCFGVKTENGQAYAWLSTKKKKRRREDRKHTHEKHGKLRLGIKCTQCVVIAIATATF